MTARPHLADVTLVAVTSVALDATLASLRHSMGQARFGTALLLSDRAPDGLAGSGITWRAIPRLASRADYSRFVMGSLAGYIETSHALLVQWDGFVRDGRAWRDEFLDYDYIGAPWPQYRGDMAVGNGGFSLRSRRLLQATAQFPPSDVPEDVAICRTHRPFLEQAHGIRFANMDVARAFSYERGDSNGLEFGVHGVFNMLAELGSTRLATWLADLEPGVIGERESTELLVKAVRTGDLPLARLALRHHRAHPRHARRLLRGLGWLLRGHDGRPVVHLEGDRHVG
ncbi:DUF5672 family protein [Sandarakinorhabdus sp. AAP62]|uniref:DUF5672 family protein n=1 Tax=Sandarakinorhabdus sp. AAP62 TaxID=1248916 RepID=UPI0002D4A714|nr:DUF5672 family protein [Sandarakinorhabdus sp. AAP62]